MFYTLEIQDLLIFTMCMPYCLVTHIFLNIYLMTKTQLLQLLQFLFRLKNRKKFSTMVGYDEYKVSPSLFGND